MSAARDPRSGRESRIYTDRYTPWGGALGERRHIVLHATRDGFRHNLQNKWVKAIIVLAWVFTVVFPLLTASFGMNQLVQDPDDAARFGDYQAYLSELDEYGISYRLVQNVEPNGTATFDIWIANSGERPDVLHVWIADVRTEDEEEWGQWLSLPGNSTACGELNVSLPAGGMTNFTLSVAPPSGLITGSADVIIGSESRGASRLVALFDEESGVTRSLTTRTILGHEESSPYHFTISATRSTATVKAGNSITIVHVIENTGTEADRYLIGVPGLPDSWKARIEGMDREGIELGPGESANFTVSFIVPEDSLSYNYVAVVGVSMEDPSLTSGSVVVIEVTDIPDVDMTADIMARPHGGLAGNLFMLFTLFLAAIAGSKAIATDLAQRSYTVYFARPIGKMDYIAIKFGTVGATLSMVTIVPLMAAYGGLILLSSVGGDYIMDHGWVWGAIVLHSLLIIIVMTSLSLAFSSLTTRRFTAAFGLVVAYFITFVMSNIIIGVFGEAGGTVISIYDSIQLTGAGIFGVEGADHDYSWGYNVLSLLTIAAISTLAVMWKINRTELSE